MKIKKKHVKKLVELISDDDLPGVKSFTRKYGVHMADIVLDDGSTLLHLACKLGHDHCMRYLIKKGVDCSLCDCHGDLPLHVAAQRTVSGNRSAYSDLVEPLIAEYPEGLDIRNNDGMTPRSVLQRLMEFYERQQKSKEHTREKEDDFNERLAHEMEDEYCEGLGKYESDYVYERLARESFSDWTDRIRKEKQQKHGRKSRHSQHRQNQREAEENRKKEFKRKLEDEHAQYVEKNTQKSKESERTILVMKKKRYEEKWLKVCRIMDDTWLSYSDIPWPSKGSIDNTIKIIVSDINLEDDYAKIRRQLRREQVRWHPDKFLHTLGSRLLVTDKERIMNRVNRISQALNNLIDKQQSGL